MQKYIRHNISLNVTIEFLYAESKINVYNIDFRLYTHAGI